MLHGHVLILKAKKISSMWGYDCRSVMWRSKWCKKGELEEYTEVLVQAPTEKN